MLTTHPQQYTLKKTQSEQQHKTIYNKFDMYIASYCMYVCIMWFKHEKSISYK